MSDIPMGPYEPPSAGKRLGHYVKRYWRPAFTIGFVLLIAIRIILDYILF